MADEGQGSVHMLLVDDEPLDVRMMLRAAKKLKLDNHIATVENGEAALKYLRREPPYEDARAADLVLLDLNMPGLTGYDVLARIKADPELENTRVVILTSSSADADVLKSYAEGASAFITKPFDPADWIQIVDALDEFWISLVRYPPT
ncbi:MAG: response regulator [Actinobacteria bacterium]|nr:response regulator [Actinomycetota bacterium]